jgi:hypothetical protein
MTTDTPHVTVFPLAPTQPPSSAEPRGHIAAEGAPDTSLARVLATPAVRFSLDFLEMQIAMVLGAVVCYLLGRLVPASSSFAAVYHPGTYLYTAGDVLFLTAPVVAWMIARGRSWRHSLEMAAAMSAPVAAIIVFGQLAGYGYLAWLVTAMYPAMCLGMLVYMLYRRRRYLGKAGQAAHASNLGGEDSCH